MQKATTLIFTILFVFFFFFLTEGPLNLNLQRSSVIDVLEQTVFVFNLLMAPLISNRESDPDASPPESNRIKRRKIDAETDTTSASVPAQLKWRSPSEQRIYSVKLAQALQRARDQATSSTAPSGVRQVRYAADRALAMAAKGKTRWSRAILAGSLNLLRNHKKVKPPTGCGRVRKLPAVIESRKRKRLPPVEKRVKILSRLVPGCKGIPVTNLLEEAGDYIAALEMQVRAMTALTDFLNDAQSGRLGSTSSS